MQERIIVKKILNKYLEIYNYLFKKYKFNKLILLLIINKLRLKLSSIQLFIFNSIYFQFNIKIILINTAIHPKKSV